MRRRRRAARRGRGRVSNYAWSARLSPRACAAAARLARELDALGAPVRAIACDTAPLAERAFAERAGLGWIGKHTNLIAPGLGSFVFLGEVVTTLELAAGCAAEEDAAAHARAA